MEIQSVLVRGVVVRGNKVRGNERRSSRRAGVILAGLLLVGIVGGVASGTANAQLGGAKAVTINVKSISFDPKKVTVKPGTKVNFVWRQTVAHNIIFDDKTLPKAKTQNKGTWVMKASSKPGTYKYKCTLHPGMAGEIVVKK